jgi:FkbM family methyltransferase
MPRIHNLLGVYTAMRRLIKHFMRPLSDRWVYTVRSGPARGMRVRGGFLFLPKPPPKEMPLLEHVAQYLPGKVAYDVGANIGLVTLFLARCVGEKGLVIAFEPTPLNADRLMENVRLNKLQHVRVYQKALGDTETVTTIVYTPDASGIATLREDLAQRYRKQYVLHDFQVEVVPLDTLVESESLPLPDFLKIDIEGYEYPMLLGARQTIQRARPMIFVELHGNTPEGWKQNYEAVYKFLDGMNYRLFAADRMPINSENLHDHGNCWLAIPREALEANVVQSP